MKTSINLKLTVIIMLAAMLSLGFSTNAQSQNTGARHEKVFKTKRVVRHKRHIKKHYRPHWSKKRTFYRRWVYFPKYNFYWDNARNRYVYLSNGVWVVKKRKPAFLVNVNLEAEKSVELTEDEDLVDNIQENNAKHIELKVE